MPPKKKTAAKTNNELDLELTMDYRELFGSELGQRVLRDIMDGGGFFSTPKSHDPYGNAEFIGRRSLVVDILDQLAYPNNPEKILDDIQQLKEERGHNDDAWTPQE